MKFKLKYLPAMSLLLAANASAATATAPVSQDGWVGPEGPGAPGATTVQDGGIGYQLNVATPGPSGASQYTRKAWFGFDLAALKAAVGTNSICSASITFQMSTNVDGSYSGNNSMRFYGVTNLNPGSIDGSATTPIFDETTLTWANAPGNIDGDVLAGDKVNGSILGDVSIPNPAAGGVMVLSGLPLANLIQTGIADTNHWITVAATYLGQNNTGYGLNGAGFQTGLSFVSKEGGAGKALISIQHQSTPCAMVIQTQPQGGCFYAGSTVNLSAQVVGAPPLSYQWTKNGSNIPGATGSTLSLPNVGTGAAANYQAVITNPTGTTNSAIASVSILSPPAITGGFEQATGTNTPIGYWRFNETAPIVQDVATNRGTLGSTGDGLYQGVVSHQQTGALVGNPNKATTFNGQYLSVPNAAALNPPTFTAEAWLKPAVTVSGATLTCAFSSIHVAVPREGWLIYQSATGWDLRTYNQNAGTVAADIIGGGPLVAGQWYHVVGVWDGNNASLYVNGVLAGTSPATNFFPNSDSPFTIGARSDGAFLWNGTADEVALYAGVLTPSQILAHYANGTNAAPGTPYPTLIATDGAVEYLRLDETAAPIISPNRGTRCSSADATYVPNSTTLGVVGINTGDAGPQPPAQLGFEPGNLAVGLSGSYLQVPALNLNKNTATIAGWVKRNGSQASFAGVVFNRANGTVAGLHFGTADELRYTWADSASTYNWDSGLIPPDGVWTFVAVVIEPTQATMYMYDGTGLSSAVNSVTHAAQGFQGPTLIGRDASSAARSYSGDLDEVAIYDQALSFAQISAIVGASRYGTTAPFITKPLLSQIIFEGESATFTVAAGGSLPLTYQWSSNGVPTSVTGPSYTVANANYNATATYAVTVSNTVGSTNSTATLQVLPPNPTYANLTNGLVLHLKFDGDYGDSSGRTNHATPVNAPTLIPGKIGSQAVRVNTAGSTFNYVEILDTNTFGPYPDLQFAAADSFSVAFWLNHMGTPNDLPIIGNAANSTYQPGWVFSDDGGKIEWTLTSVAPDPGQVVADPVPGSPVINNGAWHHIAVTFNRASGIADTYVDGVLINSQSIASIGNLDTGNGVFLGQDPSGVYGVDGTYDLDDVGIWRRALARAEAESIYRVAQSSGKSFDTFGPVILTIRRAGPDLEIIWPTGTLKSADSLTGPWTAVPGASAPYYKTTPALAKKFYQVRP